MRVAAPDAPTFDAVRRRVVEGACAVLEAGESLTFARVSRASGVPERTCYRHFPSREALLAAVIDWMNERAAVQRADDYESFVRVIRRSFHGFDERASVVRELLLSPEGRRARRSHNPERQQAALALVAKEAPGLDAPTSRRLAATLQLLGSAAVWQAFDDYWDFDGTEAAEAAVLAGALLLEGARARSAVAATKDPKAPRSVRGRSKEPRS